MDKYNSLTIVILYVIICIMKENRTKFIIVRVTVSEKEILRKKALNNREKFSNFIRKLLGL